MFCTKKWNAFLHPSCKVDIHHYLAAKRLKPKAAGESISRWKAYARTSSWYYQIKLWVINHKQSTEGCFRRRCDHNLVQRGRWTSTSHRCLTMRTPPYQLVPVKDFFFVVRSTKRGRCQCIQLGVTAQGFPTLFAILEQRCVHTVTDVLHITIGFNAVSTKLFFNKENVYRYSKVSTSKGCHKRSLE